MSTFPAEGMALTHMLVVSAAYAALNERGAQFLTPPLEKDTGIRCFFRDPDGHLFEIGESR